MGEREMSQNKSLQSKMPLAMGLAFVAFTTQFGGCLLYTSPSPRDPKTSRMPSSA